MESPESRDVDTEPPPPPAPPEAQLPPPPQAVRPELPQKAPVLAALLSLVMPGLGNVYNGLYRRAVFFFFLYVTLFGFAINGGDDARPFVIPCVVFVWLFNVFDAYRQATLLNYGLTSDPAVAQELGINAASWGIVPGVILMVLGLYGLLRRYLDIDFRWILDQWPFAVIAAGVWLIYQAVRQRQQAADETAES